MESQERAALAPDDSIHHSWPMPSRFSVTMIAEPTPSWRPLCCAHILLLLFDRNHLRSESQEKILQEAAAKAREVARATFSPSLWVYAARLLNFPYRGHVIGRLKRALIALDARVSPTATFRNGERVSIGARSHIGERCSLWAGDTEGRIDIGEDVLLGPGVDVTASNYGLGRDRPVMRQARREASVVVGNDVWLGANVVVLPGVVIGDGCVVGAGAIVTKDLPDWSIAVGVPAKVVGHR